MNELLVYCPPGGHPPIYDFLNALDEKLRIKLLTQLARLPSTPVSLMREPHIKHFTLERYSSLYEIREKNRVLVRVIFAIRGNGDILLLAPFIKRHKRNTMQALESSLKMLAEIESDPCAAVKFMRKEANIP